jgi:O-antigen biosynthesis protein
LNLWSLSDAAFRTLSPLFDSALSRFPRRLVASLDAPVWVQQNAASASGQLRLSLNEPAAGGWLFLTGCIGRLSNYETLRVVFHRPNSPETAPSVELPISKNGTFREFLLVPEGTTRLDIEPQRIKRPMQFLSVTLEQVRELERSLRMLDRVWRFNSHGLLEIPLHQRLSHLEPLYGAVRNSRVRRQKLNPYELYLDKIEPLQIHSAEKFLQGPAKAARRIRFEILVAGNDPESLERTRASLSAQIYPHWTLGSHDAAGSENLWRIPLRCGDTLRADALAQLAREAAEFPDAALIYSDHDFMGRTGQRHSPAFKPNWNRDLFCGHDYIDSLCAIQNAAWERHATPGQSPADAGARTRFILKLSDATPRSIRHLSQILCHRNAPVRDSICLGGAAQRQAIAEHLADRGATVTRGPIPGTSRVLWPLPDPQPLVSILIATRDHRDILAACIQSIQAKTTYPHWELLVIDNQSSDPATLAYLREITRDPRIRVHAYDKPFNYSALQNFGVRQSRGEILAFLNNDVEIIAPEWLEEMVRHAARPDVGAVGARLLYTDGRIQHAGVVLGIGGVAGHVHRFSPGDAPGYGGRILLTHELSAVTAACIAMRREAFERVGGFNEKDLKVALNDVDLCLKLGAAGLKNIYEPAAVLYHHESLSRGVDDTPRKRRIFHQERAYMKKKWGPLIQNDPHYNPHLSLEREDYSVRLPRERS